MTDVFWHARGLHFKEIVNTWNFVQLERKHVVCAQNRYVEVQVRQVIPNLCTCLHVCMYASVLEFYAASEQLCVCVQLLLSALDGVCQPWLGSGSSISQAAGSPLQIQPDRFIVNKPVSPLEPQPLSPNPHTYTDVKISNQWTTFVMKLCTVWIYKIYIQWVKGHTCNVSYNIRLFTVPITQNLDFLNSILMLMIGVNDAKMMWLTLFICFGPAKSWETTGCYIQNTKTMF